MQVRIKIRIPVIDFEGEKFLIGHAPLGKVIAQAAITIPMIFGFDLEVGV